MVTKMKKMKNTRYIGTSKNKRVMSGGGGGKGRVSRYTKKFKSCYNIFTKISESDADDLKNDDTKIRKMEEWGRLRGIYTYLKSKKLNESDDKTFLEQMLDNTKYSKYIQDYRNVIDCFEQNNNILLKEGCVAEKEYVNSKGSASEAPAEAPVKAEDEGQGDSENVYNPDNVKAPLDNKVEAPVKAEDEGQGDSENVYNPDNVKAPLDNKVEAPVEGDDEGQGEGQADEVNEPFTSVSLASIETGSDTEKESQRESQGESQGGGRSKRSSRSSRRRPRGKSMKSKKGRKTRRR